MASKAPAARLLEAVAAAWWDKQLGRSHSPTLLSPSQGQRATSGANTSISDPPFFIPRSKGNLRRQHLLVFETEFHRTWKSRRRLDWLGTTRPHLYRAGITNLHYHAQVFHMGSGATTGPVPARQALYGLSHLSRPTQGSFLGEKTFYYYLCVHVYVCV